MFKKIFNSAFLARLLRRKTPEQMIAQSKVTGLKKTLTGKDLIVLGVGAIVGTGIFSLSGEAISGQVCAGPSFMLSTIIASFVCMFSALSYAEFAAMIPVSGSAYTYTYSTMGEFAAWLMAWLLILEYAIGNITVAKSWSYYLINFLKGFSFVPDWLVAESLWIYQFKLFGILDVDLHLPALIILSVLTWFLYKGVEESAKAATIMVYIKLGVILLFILVGAFYVQPENWTPFAPSGINGVFQGAFIITLAYIGFDAVSTAAEETKNPQKDLPIGLIGSLIICTLFYSGVAAVITGMMPWQQVDTGAPIAAALNYVNQDWVAGFISLGALTGLTSVLLVLQLGTTRILLAIARDNFLPKSLTKIHPKYKTPHILTVITGVFVMVGTLFLTLKSAADISNVGAILAFCVVSACIIILRKREPERYRPFKIPGCPWVPLFGIASSLYLIYKGIEGNWGVFWSFCLWMAIGVVIYFTYSFKKTGQNYDENFTRENSEEPELVEAGK